MGVLLYGICHFPLIIAFNISSLTLIFVSLITMCLHVYPFVYSSASFILLLIPFGVLAISVC